MYRYPLVPGQLLPDTVRLETVQIDDHPHGVHQHQTKPIAFDDRGRMFVAFGAPSDACQEPDRTPGVAGQAPCPELVNHGGIWVFDANTLNQKQADGAPYVTGLRSVVGMDWNPTDGQLYALQHGRDYLFRQWRRTTPGWDSALLPSEEFVRATERCELRLALLLLRSIRGQKLLNPEYGGDGKMVGPVRKSSTMSRIGFPGHSRPTDLLFYRGDQFPEHYRNGAFIAFHGSTIRDPCTLRPAIRGVRSVSQRPVIASEWEGLRRTASPASIRSSTPATRHTGRWAWRWGRTARSTSPMRSGGIFAGCGTRRFGTISGGAARQGREGKAHGLQYPRSPPRRGQPRAGSGAGRRVPLPDLLRGVPRQRRRGCPTPVPAHRRDGLGDGDRDRLISIGTDRSGRPIDVNGELYNSPMPAHGSFRPPADRRDPDLHQTDLRQQGQRGGRGRRRAVRNR